MAVESVLTEKSYKPGAAMAPEALTGIVFLSPDHLVVEHWAEGATAGVLLTRDAQYIIEGDGTVGTASIRAVGVWPVDDDFRIRRETLPTQPEVLPKTQPLSSKDVERGMDRGAMVNQEHAREIGRTLRMPRGEGGITFPDAAQRRGKIFGFNSGEDASPTYLDGSDFKGDPGGNAMAVGRNPVIPTIDLSTGTAASFEKFQTSGALLAGDNGQASLARIAPRKGGSFNIPDATGTPFYIVDRDRTFEQYVTSDDVISGAGANWSPVIQRCLADAGGRWVRGEREGEYVCLDRVNYNDGPINIDGNGSRFIAPRGLLRASPVLADLATGNILATVAGTNRFIAPLALRPQIAIGRMILLRSTTSIAVAAGVYYDGQWMRVVGYNAGTGEVETDDIFYKSYQVDAITVYREDQHEIGGLFLDLTTAVAPVAGNPAIGLELTGTRTRVYDVDAVGSAYAGSGVHCYGLRYEQHSSRADKFTNTQGIIGGGRLGYGFAAVARDSLFSGCEGFGCKHLFTASSRNHRTRSVTMLDCTGTTPPDGFAAQSEDGGGILYQAAFDVHANTDFWYGARLRWEGVNNAFAIRNGHAHLQDVHLTPRGCYSGGLGGGTASPALFFIYEEAVREVKIDKVTVNATAIPANCALPYVGYLEQFPNANGSIEITNMDLQGTGEIGLFRMQGSGTPANAELITLDRLAISFQGKYMDGVALARNNPIKSIGDLDIALTGPATLVSRPNAVGPETNGRQGLLDIHPNVGNTTAPGFVRSVRVDLSRGGLDANAQRNVIDVVNIGASTAVIAPQNVRVFGPMKTARRGVTIEAGSNLAPKGYDFRDFICEYNSGNIAGSNAVRLAIATAPAEDYRFSGAVLTNAGAAPSTAGDECIRNAGAGRVNLSGLTSNTEVNIGTSYTPNPIGWRKANGARCVLPGTAGAISVDGAGKYFAAAAPAVTVVLAIGEQVINSAPAVGQPKGWTHTGAGAWVSTGVL